jgi:uncharacterized protein YneF (UPF0154 family)
MAFLTGVGLGLLLGLTIGYWVAVRDQKKVNKQVFDERDIYR